MMQPDDIRGSAQNLMGMVNHLLLSYNRQGTVSSWGDNKGSIMSIDRAKLKLYWQDKVKTYMPAIYVTSYVTLNLDVL